MQEPGGNTGVELEVDGHPTSMHLDVQNMKEKCAFRLDIAVQVLQGIQHFKTSITDGIFATLHVLGSFSMILTGPVLDKFGASVVHCLSLVLTVSGHAVLWQLTMHHDAEALPYILYVAAYIAGKA